MRLVGFVVLEGLDGQVAPLIQGDDAILQYNQHEVLASSGDQLGVADPAREQGHQPTIRQR